MIKIKVTDTQEKVYVCIKKCESQTSGGIQSVQAGTDIEVDITDPLNPIVSYIGAAVGGVQSVNSGTDISVDNTDPLNPIVNFDGDFIPLSGTEVGKPVTGDIEFDPYSGSKLLSTSDDGTPRLDLSRNDEGAFLEYVTPVELYTYLQVAGIQIVVNSNRPAFKGLRGNDYYGANYDNNTYVQKKYVDDNFAKIAPNKRLVNATTSGTFNLNHSLYSDWKLTLTGATTLTDSNLPTGDYTIEFTMKITGSFGLTLPSYWSVNGDTYDGTKWNFFAIQVHKGDVGSEEVTVFITNLA